MSEDTYVGTISKHEMVVDRYDYEYMEEEIKRLKNLFHLDITTDLKEIEDENSR